MTSDLLIRPETAGDREGVEALLPAALPTPLGLCLVWRCMNDAGEVSRSAHTVRTAPVLPRRGG